MRVVLAGCFVFGTIVLVAVLVGSLIPKAPPSLIAAASVGAMLGTLILAMRLFNRAGAHPLGLKSHEQQVAELEANGLLLSERFTASRAFSVEEFEDEGSHYFVALTDSRVLFLSGQYLYDYEPLDEDEGLTPRRFPCRSFTVRWHRTGGYTVDLVCDGEVLEPEATLPAFGPDLYRAGFIPADRTVIADRTYEALKQQFRGRGS